MIKVRRIGHATFETPDLPRAIEYHTEVLGLVPVSQGTDHAFFAARTGQLAIELRRGSEARCVKLAFEVAPEEDFSDTEKRLTALGVTSLRRADSAPGLTNVLTFEDPKGTTIEIFNTWKSVGRVAGITGVGPLKLGHIAFHVSDPKAISDFYARVLGFKVSDWIDDFFVFMRCNADHHTVNFITGPHGTVHHIAFELRDFSHLQNACDLFGQKDIKIVWGPVRLGPGHNVAAFTHSPDGHAIEVYAELDQMKDESLGYWDPRPWHKDHPQYPKTWPRGEGSLYIWGPPPTPDFRRADTPTRGKK